jgi:uncharacterized membrane protein
MLQFLRKNLPKSFLTKDETEILEKRVAQFEEKTGCELVFHFRRKLGPKPTEFNRDLFYSFKLDKTSGGRGILITLALKEKKFAVWADHGVAIHTGDKLWTSLCKSLARDLKTDSHLQALINCIAIAEDMLQGLAPHKHFENELSNKPIIEDD